MEKHAHVAYLVALGVLVTACSASTGQSPGRRWAELPKWTGLQQSCHLVGQPIGHDGTAAGSGGAYELPDGLWSAGQLHLEVSDGFSLILDLPLAHGETDSRRTTLVFENFTDDDYSIGTVSLAVILEVDGFYLKAGGLEVQGSCAYTFDRAVAGDLAGGFTCEEDLQAYVAGDPRLVMITGSFSASG